MKRREARECAFSLLFQIDFWPPEDVDSQIELYFEQYPENMDEFSIEFIKQEVVGAYTCLEYIDNFIDKYLKNWAIERIAKADLAILRLAIYEIVYNNSIPESVSVNEAVELAKKYGNDESPSFVNGILGKIVSELNV